jgi:DNA adenine methylase
VTNNSVKVHGFGLEGSTRPFLRWAGSKRRLLPKLVPRLPREYNRYFEPFLGGGSVFFALKPEAAVLSDINFSLIQAFRAIRDDVDHVIRILREMDYSEEWYYRLRGATSTSDRWEAAARFIALNLTCWNGLYRENSQGKFNVPFGSRENPDFLDETRLRAASVGLRHAVLLHADFETVLKRAEDGDLVYVDPPYVTLHTRNGFSEYNKRLFKWEDQVRLAKVCRSLVERGTQVVLTNGSHESITHLYPDFQIDRVRGSSTIAASVDHRGRSEEAIIRGGFKRQNERHS